MLKTKYMVTVDLRNTIHVFRQLQNNDSARSLLLLPKGLNCDSAECAAQLALALLNDCVRNEARALRLQQSFVDLLVCPLLRRAAVFNCRRASGMKAVGRSAGPVRPLWSTLNLDRAPFPFQPSPAARCLSAVGWRMDSVDTC